MPWVSTDVPLPLRVVSAYAFLSGAVLLGFGVLLLAHVRTDPDPDGIWLVPSTGLGYVLVGVLVRRRSVWAWLTVLLTASAAVVFGVPGRLAGLVVVVVQLCPSTLRFVGLLAK
jgi:hypothetical protein